MKLNAQQWDAMELIQRSLGEGFDETSCTDNIAAVLRSLSLPSTLVTFRDVDDGKGNKTTLVGLTECGFAVLEYGTAPKGNAR
jgi:hypothetical protein